MNKILLRVGATIGTLMTTSAFAESAATADNYQLNMRKGVTDLSVEVYDLHMLMFAICVGIAIVVFGAMFYSMPVSYTHLTLPTN